MSVMRYTTLSLICSLNLTIATTISAKMDQDTRSTIPAPLPSDHSTQLSFPEELPARRFKQTWMQRNRFDWRTFFTLNYRSFSLRHRPDARDKWRRTSMWIIMFMRVGLAVMAIFQNVLFVYLNAAGIVLIIFVTLIAAVLVLINAWNLALIGDVQGTRRAVGFTVRRKGLDWFLHITAFLHTVLAATLILFLGYGAILPTLWVFFGLVIFGVALMASKEPLDEQHNISM